MIPTHLLEAFVEVAQRGSVTAAARALGRTQPALSNRLRQLEDELGLVLFEPKGRGLGLTAAGTRLLEECAPLLASLRTMAARHQHLNAQTPSGVVRVGTLPTMARYYLLETLHQGIKALPQVKWCVEIGLAEQLLKRLREQEIELLYLIGDFDITGLEVEDLGEVKILAVASPALLSPGETLEVALKRAPLLLWRGANDPSFEQIERHARALGLVGPTAIEIPHIETLKALAIQGAGVALLPDYLVAQDIAQGALAWRPFTGFERSFPIRRYQRAHVQLSAGAQWFLEAQQRRDVDAQT